MRRIILLEILILVVVLSHAQSADEIVGVWLTADMTGEVTIYKTSGKYFGKITAGTSDQKFDIHNPDKDRRNDPLIGLVILKELAFNPDDRFWQKGTVYDPMNGKQYSCNIKLLNRNTLKITGYIGFSWIGRSEEWTRIK